MQIRINRHECCGHGQCVEIAPDVFALDQQRKSMVLDAEAAPPDKVYEAAEACPCQAIVLENDEGNTIYP